MIVGCAVGSFAQETVDSIAPEELNEVVIEAPKVIRKADMDVYHPSQSAIDNSKNGIQLINNLMIPSLTINDALSTIQAAGQSVQVRINGREASLDQVRALLPETIKRVEWIDNPGLRYAGANYVINLIVANPTVGGSLMTKVQQILTTPFGTYMADAKFNSGYSQWQVGAYGKLTNNIKTSRDYTETFTYPDGASITRDETSRGGHANNDALNAWASYNYIKPDTTVFVAELSLYSKLNDKEHYDGLLSLSNGTEDIYLTDTQGSNGNTPSLSLYWQQNFARKQMLVLNFYTSLYWGRTYSDYIEQYPGADSYLTDVHTNIKDRNQVYSLEANYIKKWANSRFTAGASYTANRNRSTYLNLEGKVFHQRQDKVYMFAEYFQRFGKWTATAGMGVHYTNYLFKESERGNHSWRPRPQATLTYSINPRHNLRLNFTSWQSTPSLSQTNTVPQQLDGFQWQVGNPNLKTSNSYMLTLRYGFNLPRINGTFGVRAFSSPNAITPLMTWNDDKLITSYENSRGLQNISFFLAPQIEIIPNLLTISGYIQYRAERMRGTGYTLYNHGWCGNVDLQVTYRGFELSVFYNKAQRDLWGEKITWGEDMSAIELNYNWKNWQFSAGYIMPFARYDQGSKSLSHWNNNEKHMRVDLRMPFIGFSYNIQWGHQKRGAQKLINSDVNVDTSKAAGR